MKNLAVFINPRSRNGKEQSSFVFKWLTENGYHVVNPNPYCHSNEIDESLSLIKDQIDVVLIGGGDGSLREALPALLKADLPVLYLPVGTLNNLGTTLNLPSNIEESLKLLQDHKIKEIDIGSANGVLFHSIVGLGISTQTNRLVRSDLKRWLGMFAFVWAGLKVVYRMSPFKVKIYDSNSTHHAWSWQVTVCNGKYYGSGFVIDPNASQEDQTLRGFSMEKEKWWKIPFHVWHFSGSHFHIKTRRPMRVDLDGDVKTRTPLELKLISKRLKILTP